MSIPTTAAADLAAWFDFHHRPHLREATATDYFQQIAHLAAWLGRPPRLGDLSAATIFGVCNWQRERGRSAATADKARRSLRAIWSAAWLRDQMAIGRPAELPAWKADRFAPAAWTREEMAALLRTLPDLAGPPVGTHPRGRWALALILLAYNSGLRLRSLMAARWEWFEADDLLRIPPAWMKNHQGIAVGLWASTAAALEAIRGEAIRGEVFSAWTWDRGGEQWPALNGLLRRAIVAAGLRPDVAAVSRRDLWHKLRRTFATHVYIASGDIERVRTMLGHSAIEVTYRYLDRSQIAGELQRDLLPDPLAGEPRAGPAGWRIVG